MVLRIGRRSCTDRKVHRNLWECCFQKSNSIVAFHVFLFIQHCHNFTIVLTYNNYDLYVKCRLVLILLWSVGRSVGFPVKRSIVTLVSLSVGRSVGLLICGCTDRFIGPITFYIRNNSCDLVESCPARLEDRLPAGMWIVRQVGN